MFKLYYIITYPLTLLSMYLIWLYKLTLSHLIGHNCKYLPTCSTYALMCIKEFGAIWGWWLAIKRLFRCRPNVPAGIDLPKLNLRGNYKYKC